MTVMTDYVQQQLQHGQHRTHGDYLAYGVLESPSNGVEMVRADAPHKQPRCLHNQALVLLLGFPQQLQKLREHHPEVLSDLCVRITSILICVSALLFCEKQYARDQHGSRHRKPTTTSLPARQGTHQASTTRTLMHTASDSEVAPSESCSTAAKMLRKPP
jgi:hypothetical protein